MGITLYKDAFEFFPNDNMLSIMGMNWQQEKDINYNLPLGIIWYKMLDIKLRTCTHMFVTKYLISSSIYPLGVVILQP